LSVELALIIGGELITFKAETYYDKRLGQYLTGHKELDMMSGFGLYLEAKYVGSGEKYQTVRELLTRACLRAFNREPGFFPITSSGVLMGYVEGAGDASAFRISLEDVYDEYYKEVYGESLPRGLEPGSNPGPEHNLHPYLAEQEKEAGTEPLRAGRGVESIDNTPKEAKQEGAQVPTRADGQADGNYTASKTPETPLFCFQCGEPLGDHVFRCKYCGEALCERHKKPESHYCLPFREKHPMETEQRRFVPHYHTIHAHDDP
jgi:hypothetical protein